MSYQYLVTPFIAWFIAGSLKFLINSIVAKKAATTLIGYGGLPSNHSTIVCSMATLIGLREGIEDPAFGVAVTLAFIVMLDASSLRRQVGKHAMAINLVTKANNTMTPTLRERMGHTPTEILAGVLVGVLVALTVNHFLR
jgi:acid phosphatase family membrane protein YuiD